MKRLLLWFLASGFCLTLHAQLLTWTPPFPREDDPSQTLNIIVDATKGNQGLLNFTGDVYVHIGVITNKSAGGWAHTPFTWATTPPAAKAISLGNNKWQYTITGSLRSFFGLTDASETIQKIGILFRSGDGNRSIRNNDGSDMFVPVYPAGLQVRIDQPARYPYLNPLPEPQNWSLGSSFTVKAVSSQNADLTIYHNGKVIGNASGVQSLSANGTVSTAGLQQFIVKASAGGTDRFDTLSISVSAPAALPAGTRDGINYLPGDTSVILVLRAPGKSYVNVIGDFNNWQQDTSSVMNVTPDGKFWWRKVDHLKAGQEYAYQYVVDGSLKIADPYTEKILDPTPGGNNKSQDQNIPESTYPNLKPYPAGQTGIVSVLQTAPPAYTWKVNSFSRPDKRGLVIYELLVRDFVAAHNWKTVMDSLNYLKNLGINAIELMPFNEFEGNDSWGYNPDFYFAPDKYYGTANSLKQFIDSCHSKGIAVIMDIALNHSFGQSPMVQLYWDAGASRPSANSPWFNPVAKHAFNVGFDMNHQSPDTRYYVGRVTEHWLTQYKIDGFRFDLSKGFTQVQTCDDNGGACDVGKWSSYDGSRIAIWKGYYDTVQSKSSNAYVILEHLAEDKEEQELAAYGMMLWGNMNYNYGQAAMGYSSDWDFSRALASEHGFASPHLVAYMESHDEERIVYKNINFGASGPGYSTKDPTTAQKRMELASAFFFTLPGPKMLWQFGELGYDYSINTCTNGTVDNDCRLSAKPIRWDYLQVPTRKNIYNTYSKLINLRFHPLYKNAFLTGTLERNFTGPVKWIKLASSDTAQMVVVGNFDVKAQQASITFPHAGNWFDYLDDAPFTATGTAQTMTLQPGEYHVWLNRNVNHLATTPVPEVSARSAVLTASVFPNPANAPGSLKIGIPRASKMKVSVYNAAGQYQFDMYDRFFSAGEHILPVQKERLSPGAYYLRIISSEASTTLKLIIQ